MWERAYLGAGLLLYDTLGGARSVPRHRHLSRTRVGAEFPALRRDGVVGAVQFYDAAEDDARMVAMVARTAAAHGAHLVTRARVLTLRRDGRRVTGAEVVDSESGDTVSVSARHVAVAVGAWTDEVRGGLGTRFSTRMVPSKGVHIVVARDRIPLSTGLLARTEKSVLFVVPSPGGWLIGDTDTPWPYGPDLPVASGADVDYLLAKVNALLADPLTRDDVRGVFAGIRPLVGPAEAGSGGDTTRLSRNHVIDTSVPGLTTIAGGKYTTYRVMAADLIDAAVRDFGGGRVPPSGTSRIPIFGGSRPAELAALVDDDPSLAEPLPGGEGHVAAEVVHACLFEGALHLEDVLERRTRLAIMSPDRGLEAAPAAAALMASRLDWTAEQVDAEVEAWRRRVAAERAGEAQPEDERALRAYRAALAGDPAEVASR
jgi:glycerol-3-phosphate dehydrogenase